jgi:hypothetical protein
VAGCLQPAAPSPTGTSGTAAPPTAAATDGAAKPEAASGDAKFVLANAVPSAAEPTASASPSSAPMTYRLIANEAALSPHVGKKLELTGTIDDQDGSPRSPGAEPNRPPATSSAANGPKLRVETGKVLAEPCMP